VANTVARIAAAVDLAIAALANPKCAGLFNLDPNAPSPAALLAAIQSGSDPHAFFTEENLPPLGPGLQTNAITQPTSYSSQNGTLVSTGKVTGVETVFNWSPSAPFNTASVIANAITVLHELGHIYEALYGMGSTLLVNDSSSAQGSANAAAASAFNTSLVQVNCFPGSH